MVTATFLQVLKYQYIYLISIIKSAGLEGGYLIRNIELPFSAFFIKNLQYWPR